MGMWWSTSVVCLLAVVFGGAPADSMWVVDAPRHAGARFARDVSTSPVMTQLVINSAITYRYAMTTIFNTVRNNAAISNEITFKATLPQAAYISAFHIEVGGHRYVGEVKTRAEADEKYGAARSAGRTAALVKLASEKSNLFTVSVNVEANEVVSFNLTYEELLVRNQGGYTHVLYIDPGQIVNEMEVTICINDTSNIKDLNIEPLWPFDASNPDAADEHAVIPTTERPTPTSAIIEWSPTPDEQRAMRDSGVEGRFIVEFDVDRTTNPNQILVNQDYFVHFYAPSDLDPMDKHVVFVLDTSGSMDATKLIQLKDAMGKILEDMRPNDFFTIIEFNSVIKMFLKSGHRVQLALGDHVGAEFVIAASPDNIRTVTAAIRALPADGLTNIHDSLMMAVQVVDAGAEKFASVRRRLEPIIIFLTDGEANEGAKTQSADIVVAVVAANNKSTSIHCLGFGSGADMSFLRDLSLKTGVYARRIHDGSGASSQLTGFYAEVSSPLLRDVKMGFKNVVSETLTKLGLKTLNNGTEWVTAGRANAAQGGKIRGSLTAKSRTGSYSSGFPKPLQVPASDNFLERLWAYLTIRQLLEEPTGISTENFIKAQAMALKYSFVTPLTSLVVVRPDNDDPSTLIEMDFVDVRMGIDEPEPSSKPQIIQPWYEIGHGADYQPEFDDYSMHSWPESDLRAPVPENAPVATQATTTTPAPTSAATPKASLVWDSSVFSNSTVKITKGGTTKYYEVASMPPHSKFSVCRLSSGVRSNCKHLNTCILSEFQDNFSVYESSYFCSIDGIYAGVCCP